MDTLRESMKILQKELRLPGKAPPPPQNILGYKVHINPLLDNMPKMQLSIEARRVVTPEFAREMDKWMLEFFGTKDEIYATVDSLMMGPKSYAKMKGLR
jgi:hypothetical protein